MLDLSAALIRRLLPELTEEPPRVEGFRTWIETGSFYVSVGSSPDSIVLNNIALTEFVPYVSYDYERFALSSLESLLFCNPEAKRPKAIGWPIAKIYYSAFFGAHAIMRATGHGVLRVENAQASRISKLISIFVPNFQIGSGTYYSRILQNLGSSPDVSLVRIADTGGAHDQFWRSFYNFLAGIMTEVSTNNEPNATAAVSEASEIRDTLAANGFNTGTWLSAVRNQITYQHKHGVWFPFYSSPTEAVKHVRRIGIRDSSTIRRDYNAAKEPLQAFCACCQLIAAINIDLANAICERNNTRRFSQLWTRLKSG